MISQGKKLGISKVVFRNQGLIHMREGKKKKGDEFFLLHHNCYLNK
jgi:hypothetical protein